MPTKAAEIWQRLGWQPPAPLGEGRAWGRLQPGAPVTVGEPLFPRKEEVHRRDAEKEEKKELGKARKEIKNISNIFFVFPNSLSSLLPLRLCGDILGE